MQRAVRLVDDDERLLGGAVRHEGEAVEHLAERQSLEIDELGDALAAAEDVADAARASEAEAAGLLDAYKEQQDLTARLQWVARLW